MSHQDRSITRYPGAEVVHDQVASESPLEIRVEGTSVAITMRTPGDDLDLDPSTHPADGSTPAS